MVIDLFNVPQLTPGRVRYALSQMPPAAADAPGMADRLAEVQQAAAAAVEIRKAYDRSKGQSRARGVAKALDNEIDRLVGAIATVAQANQAAMPASDPTHQASKALMQTVLPLGARAVTSLPFEDELSAVKEMLADLDAAGDLAARAGVAHLVEALTAKVGPFEAELAKQAAIVDYKQVEAQYMAMQRAVVVLLAQIVANHAEPAQAAGLAATLAPLNEQFERVRDLRRRRRAVVDVDPESGVEIGAGSGAEGEPE